ncbi:MAG: 30S ribosomal protein S2 [Thermoguttaceae bacterium]|jgi:small subunit ribosomal protein S2
MAELSIEALIESGVHLGHRTSLWNPKMRPYIYGRRKLIHIIDLRETVRGILRAKKFLKKVAGEGNLVLFVGTKRQASETIQTQAERCGMPYISERWLGGTLTNFETIRSRLQRLEELESIMEGDVLQTYSKKMQASLAREYRKIYRNLNGLRKMDRYPAAMVVIDPSKEKNAVREARKLGVVSIALIDTDSDPDEVDLPIPGNDDSIRSIDLIVSQLVDAVAEGVKEREATKFEGAPEEEAAEVDEKVAADDTAS